jgi:NAD(P)-dependent dehydrogenase (short-subunit alcohol dehydrogenase family)
MVSADSGPPQDFAGKTALITGATRGIGLAIAKELAERGARTVITARKPDEIEAAVEEIGAATTIGVRGGADDETHQAEAVSEAIKAFGSLDILVNNAATNPYVGPFIEADLGVVRKTIEVNLVAPFAWAQLAYRAWMKDHGGAILNIASVAGLRTGGSLNVYGMTKAALVYQTAQLAAELGPDVRVNALAPAVVKTKFARTLYEHDETAVAAPYPMKRLGTPRDIGKVAAFLLGPDAGWITGEVVTIDGGIVAAGKG